MRVRNVTLVLGVCLLAATAAAELPIAHADRTAAARDGRMALAFNENGLDLGADLTVRTKADRAEVRPRLSSGFALGRVVDVETNLVLPDLAAGLGSGRASVDTRVRLREPLPFVERVDTRIRQARNGTSRRTAIHFAAPLAVLDKVRGHIEETAGGDSKYALELGFDGRPGVSGRDGAMRLSGEATFSETTPRSGRPRARASLRAVLAGSGPAGGAEALAVRGLDAYELSLGFEQRSAAAAERVAARLELEQSWIVHELATLDLNLKLTRTANATDKSFEIAWQTAF